MMPSDRTRVISALGVVQVFAWGSTYYLLTVLIEPTLRDTGWPRAEITAGISVALLASGLVSVPVGRLIQRRGGRPVLAGAMVLMAAGLGLMAVAPDVMMFLLAWAVTGIGMAGGLYDATFSTLGRLYGTSARRAITVLTLWGGFASTVCWPISAWMVEAAGWRGTCLFYAAFHLAVSLPLCLTLPREARRADAGVTAAQADRPAPIRDLRFWLLAAIGTVKSFTNATWSVLLISILLTRGVSTTEAVALGALIGPAQVGGRIVEMAFGNRYHPVWTTFAAAWLVGLGFLGLLFHIPASLALIAYGAGNGVWSIAQGAMPLALFGPEDYPSLMGKLATPAMLAAATAPAIGGALLGAFGGETVLLALTLVSLVPITCAFALLMLRRAPATQTCRQTFTAE